MTKLSDTARAILTAASQRSDHVALPPERLPVAAQRSVIRSLLKARLLEEIAADDDQPAWRTDDAGERHALRLTLDGMAAVVPATDGNEAASAETAETGPCGAEPGAEGPRAAEPPKAAQEGLSAPAAGSHAPDPPLRGPGRPQRVGSRRPSDPGCRVRSPPLRSGPALRSPTVGNDLCAIT